MAFDELYVKFNKNNSQVFIRLETINVSQFNQIMAQIKVNVPKLKLQQLGPPNNDSKPSIALNCDNSELIDNKINKSNEVNVSLSLTTITQKNKPKRKLRSDSGKKHFRSNDKKQKYDFKPIGGRSLNTVVNTVDENQTKNKENKNTCNIVSELSRVIGLPNMGNTCYINSIIQVLRMTPGFRQFVCSLNKSIAFNKSGIKLKNSNKKLISCLHNIFVHFGENEVNINKSSLLTNESKITELIKCEDIKKRFELGQQQDCHEFLSWLIDELNSFAKLLFTDKNNSKKSVQTVYNTRRRNSNGNQSMTFESFQGVMLREIMCSECQKGSYTRDSFADIQIPLCFNDEVTDICESQTFTQIIHKKDYLSDENKFDCDNCSKKTNAFVVNSIESPPKVLIIFFKKPLEYNRINTRNIKPMKRSFTVPLHLEYSPPKGSIHYSLYGFVMHSGSDIDNGHYYAVIDSGVSNRKMNNECNCALNVLSNNGWIKVNDHKVSKLQTSHLNKLLDNNSIASSPYLAFYQRID